MSEESRAALIEGFKLTGHPSKLVPLKLFCPTPIRHSQDQHRCIACGMVWDTDEIQPVCPNLEARL